MMLVYRAKPGGLSVRMREIPHTRIAAASRAS